MGEGGKTLKSSGGGRKFWGVGVFWGVCFLFFKAFGSPGGRKQTGRAGRHTEGSERESKKKKKQKRVLLVSKLQAAGMRSSV